MKALTASWLASLGCCFGPFIADTNHSYQFQYILMAVIFISAVGLIHYYHHLQNKKQK